jgi:hypothetical protein
MDILYYTAKDFSIFGSFVDAEDEPSAAGGFLFLRLPGPTCFLYHFSKKSPACHEAKLLFFNRSQLLFSIGCSAYSALIRCSVAAGVLLEERAGFSQKLALLALLNSSQKCAMMVLANPLDRGKEV